MTTTKTLDGKEYKLDERYSSDIYLQKKKYNPDILIIPFTSFGIGNRLNFEKIRVNDNNIEIGCDIYNENSAIVTALYEKDGKIIIEAEKDTKKEEKMKFVNKIIRKINFSDSLNDKLFISLLSNVFTDKQLEQFINEDDLEIILFNGLMYLKVRDKAYRL